MGDGLPEEGRCERPGNHETELYGVITAGEKEFSVPFLSQGFHAMGVMGKIQRRYYLTLVQVVLSSLAEVPGFWKRVVMFPSSPEDAVDHWNGYYNTLALRLARAT